MTKVVFSSELDKSDISGCFGDISDNLHDKSDISTKIFDKSDIFPGDKSDILIGP